MSALANYLLDRGEIVGGVDREYHRGRCVYLQQRGLVLHPQGEGGLALFVSANAGCEFFVIRSTAVEHDTPEMREADRLGLQVRNRVEFLTEIFNAARTRVAIVGSAGKTTVAALLSYVLFAVGIDPSYAIGGMIGSMPNGRCGHGGIFIAEADESDGSVVYYHPDLVLFTNLFKEHRSLHELRFAFQEMFTRMPQGGFVLYSDGDPTLMVESPRAMIQVGGVLQLCSAGASLSIRHGDSTYNVPLAGRHNFRNVELAVEGAIHLGVDVEDALRALESFPGVERRMTHLGQSSDVCVYLDFAHSPDEILASYSSAKELGRRVIYVYQPHGYRPTHVQREALVSVFDQMRFDDILILTEIYYGGGTVAREITGEELFSEARRTHQNTFFVGPVQEVPSFITTVASAGDVVVLAGARTVCDYGSDVLSALRFKSAQLGTS